MYPNVNWDMHVLEIMSLLVSSALWESKLLAFEMTAIETWILERIPCQSVES